MLNVLNTLLKQVTNYVKTRRGTLGTGVKELHKKGDELFIRV